MASTRLFLSFSLALTSAVSALVCFQNGANGTSLEVANEEWRYCSLIPFAGPNGMGRQMGLGEETENLTAYDIAFGQNSELYKLRVLCLLEEYKFDALVPGAAPEVLFRCLCGTDRCNEATTFAAFIKTNHH